MALGSLRRLATLGAVFEFVNRGSRELKAAHGDLDGLHTKIKDVIRETRLLGLTGPQLAAAGGAMAAFGAVGLLALGRVSGAAQDLEAGVGQVNTLLDAQGKQALTTQDQMNGLLSMSSRYGVESESLVGSLFQVVSASVNAADAMAVMETATRAARAGNADLKSTTTGIVQTMNAYGNGLLGVASDTEAARKVSDIFFKTNVKGLTTVEEITNSLSNVAPTAAKLKIPLEELGAALAAITSQGTKLDKASTFLNQALASILKPSKEAQDEAKRLGIDFDSATLKTMHLAGFVDMLTTAVGDDDDAMAKLFGSVEAFKAIAQLTSENGLPAFRNALVAMGDAAGSTDEALRIMEGTSKFQRERRSQSIANIAKSISIALLPATSALSGAIADLASGIGRVIRANPGIVRGLAALAAAASVAFVVVGGLALVAGAVVTAVAAWTVIGPIVAGAGAAISAFALASWPLILGVTAAVAALGAAMAGLFVWVGANSSKIGRGFDMAFPEGMDARMKQTADGIAVAFGAVGAAVRPLTDALGITSAEMGNAEALGYTFGQGLRGLLEVVDAVAAAVFYLADGLSQVFAFFDRMGGVELGPLATAAALAGGGPAGVGLAGAASAAAGDTTLGDVAGGAIRGAGRFVTGMIPGVALARGVSGVASAVGGLGGERPINVAVNVDGKQIARAQARANVDAGERTGGVDAADVGALADR